MNLEKNCKTCGETKKCVYDSTESGFYQIGKSKNFRNVCKVCYRKGQNVRDKNNEETKKANADTGCPSAESLILRTIKWIEENIGANNDEYKKRLDTLAELNSQINIEKKINTDQYMYFSKQDINYNTKDPITRENGIVFAVCVTISSKLSSSIDTKDVYIFDRLDKIKIVIDKDINITNEIRAEIKTKLAE